MSDQPSPDDADAAIDAIDDVDAIDELGPPPHSRAVAIAAIAAVLVLGIVFMAVRLRLRGTSYDGLCTMVAAPGRTC